MPRINISSPTPAVRPWLLWLPVVVYMAGIFIASSVSDPQIPTGVSDVSLHGVAYFGLTLLLIRALAGGRWAGVTGATVATAWAIAVLYGVSPSCPTVMLTCATCCSMRSVRSPRRSPQGRGV
jgi:hypothetical protein